MTLTALLVLGLSTWRLTSLFVSEDGPFDIFDRIRFKAGVRYDAYSNPIGTNVLAKAMSCMWCFSIWIAALLVLGWMIFIPNSAINLSAAGGPTDIGMLLEYSAYILGIFCRYVVYVLTCSAIAIFAEKTING